MAYDVLVYVGQALFRNFRTLEEVQSELKMRNTHISLSEIDHLGRKFIKYLALAHAQAAPRIRQKMRMAGGYVLHLDAAHEGDAPTLFSGLDSLSQFVLGNIKTPSENADHIKPFLKSIQDTYGLPVACVHDMGTGICKAVNETFPGTPDFICHFHFLRDVGKDFLGTAYSRLRNRLKSFAATTGLRAFIRQIRQSLGQSPDLPLLVDAVNTKTPPHHIEMLPSLSAYSLGLWALQGKRNGNGHGFPFDRPLLEFTERMLELDRYLPRLLENSCGSEDDQKPLRVLAKKISKVANDPELIQTTTELRWRVEVFDDLRSAMRIATPDESNGLNDDGSHEAMSTIRQDVEKFRQRLDKESHLADDHLSVKMARQIDKYGEKLFADPITVVSPQGLVTIYPQRTNNILERFFRGLRRGHRRKTGNNSMRRTLQAMIADTPLVKNLDNPEYMEILLNGKDSLEELFASIRYGDVKGENRSNENTDRILPGGRAIIKKQKLPEQILEFFMKTKTAQGSQSN
ncbi:transposase [Desulfonatronum thioautotrophicum]|uniref:transposase n=1 Tax=Desulfonatronum thioautotrophicum TaxID=617001 RepID=UPI0005EB7AFC|nr:transposase [Desulfonatronum thioautotrophicum]